MPKFPVDAQKRKVVRALQSLGFQIVRELEQILRFHLSLDDFDDAFGVDAHDFRLAEKNNNVIILWCADVSEVAKAVLDTVNQSHCKRAKRLALQQTSDFFNFHSAEPTPEIRLRQPKRGRYGLSISPAVGDALGRVGPIIVTMNSML